MTDCLDERLKWLDPNKFQRSDSCIVVKETAKEGEAELRCYVQHDSIAIELDKDDQKRRVNYLKNKRVTDCLILEFLKPEVTNIHIVECKRTIKAEKWREIKEQFEGSLLNALCLCGLLGINELKRVTFYTAFRNDNLNPAASTNTIIGKRGVATPLPSSVSDWRQGKISILSLTSAPHIKIPLDDNGKGDIRLT